MRMVRVLFFCCLVGVFGCETTGGQSSAPAGTANQPNMSGGGASGSDLPNGAATVKFRMKGVK